MRRIIFVPFTLITLIIILAGLWIAAPAAGGGPAGGGPEQADATSQQATLDASVQTLFAQTAQAPAVMTEAVATAFSAAQTATAAAGPAQPVAADTLKVAQVIELPLLAAPARTSAYLAPDGNRIAYLHTNALCILDIDKVAADVQNAVNAGTAVEHALDGMTEHPDQFPGVACLSVEKLKALDWETIRWSPDGRYLAMSENFFQRYVDSDIWVVDTQSMTLADITDDGVTKFDLSTPASAAPPIDVVPRWLPDGRLVFIRYTGKGQDFDPPYVFTVSPDGSHLQQAGQLDTPLKFAVSALSVSAQGKLAYNVWSNDDKARSGIWISDLEGSNARQVWSDQGSTNDAPLALDWSPDGQYVAYASTIGVMYNAEFTPEFSFWRAIRVSDGQQVFFSPDYRVLSAGWSPEGSAVVYTTRNFKDTSTEGLYIAAAPGAPGRLLVPAQTDTNGPQMVLMSTTSRQEQIIPWAANNTVMVGRGGAAGILIVRLAAP